MSRTSTLVRVRVPSDLIGLDGEQVYADLLHTKVVGGEGDGGIDVVAPQGWGFPGLQVKSSIRGLMEFLKKALQLKARFGSRFRWIPVAVGDPPEDAEELREACQRFGGWIGREVPNRLAILSGLQTVREFIEGRVQLDASVLSSLQRLAA